MAQTKCDMSRWPIVHFSLGGKSDIDQVHVVIHGLGDALARKSAFCTITNMTEADTALKAPQEPYREFIDKNRDELRKYCRGGALVVNSQAVRVIINTFVLVAKIPFPTRAFNTQEEAATWCSGLLRADKIAS